LMMLIQTSPVSTLKKAEHALSSSMSPLATQQATHHVVRMRVVHGLFSPS